MENNELFSQSENLPQPLLTVMQVAFLLITRTRTYVMQRGVIPSIHIGIKAGGLEEDLQDYILDNIYCAIKHN